MCSIPVSSIGFESFKAGIRFVSLMALVLIALGVSAIGEDEAIAVVKGRIQKWIAKAGDLNRAFNVRRNIKGESNTRSYAIQNSGILLKTGSIAEIDREFVVFKNSRYTAKIERAGQGDWAILELELAGENSGKLEKYIKKANYFFVVTGGSGVVEYLRSGNYLLKNVSKKVIDGDSYLTCRVEFNNETEVNVPFPLEYAVLWFKETDESAFPKRVDFHEVKRDKTLSTVYADFKMTSRGLIPSSATNYLPNLNDEWSVASGALSTVMTFNYDQLDDSIPSEEFFLAHYGLPEPKIPGQGYWMTWGILLGCGAISFLVWAKVSRS